MNNYSYYTLDPEAENQLKKYREEQRRRHAQVARENTADANSSQPYHPSPILHTTPSYPTPSAPPMDDNGRNLYPSLSSHNTEENLKVQLILFLLKKYIH